MKIKFQVVEIWSSDQVKDTFCTVHNGGYSVFFLYSSNVYIFSA